MSAWLLDLSPLLPGAGGWLLLCVLLGAVLVALAVDELCGEPPLRWPPVVWMGRALDALGQRVAQRLAGMGRGNGRLMVPAHRQVEPGPAQADKRRRVIG